jgi:hypothetical protein
VSDRQIRVGCSAGFWGDTLEAAGQLIRQGDIDYLVSDYLSEVTMSILARMRLKDPNAGYVPDFVASLKGLLPDIVEKKIRVITNAGGINPSGCRQALLREAEAAGVELSVAVVDGDDLMPRLSELRQLDITEMDSGEPLPGQVASINAYLGAAPIAAALGAGAQVVITGRCTDSATTLGALMHEFGWQPTDYNRLACGSLAGHIIECGAQATGGLFTDWEEVSGWDDMGFPVVTCGEDGSFEVSKPPDTGGMVTPASVSEQIVYEVGDPARYRLPDVSCDFSNVTVRQKDTETVSVSGARGRAPGGQYKVSVTFVDGFRCIATVMLAGAAADAKARRVADAILRRCRRLFGQHDTEDFSETSIEVIGAEESYGTNARVRDAREVILKIGVRHESRDALELFAREVIPAGTSMAQGLTGVFGGRPKVTPVVRLFSFLIDKAWVPARVDINGRVIDIDQQETANDEPVATTEQAEVVIKECSIDGETTPVPLITLAHGRSGDKGNHANIGIIARSRDYVSLLRDQLTSAVVAEYFAHYLQGEVIRYEWPGLNAFNFLLKDVLGGGGMASLRYDPQGKTYAQMLLDIEIEIPAAWLKNDKELALRAGLS